MSDATQPLIEDAWKDRLRAVLTEQHDLVSQLATLVEKQESLISEGKTEPLLALLSDRQRIVDRIAERQEELSELTRNLEARLEHLPPDERQQFRSLIDGITEHLGHIMARDEQDRSTLQSRRDKTHSELQSISSVKQARNAYLTKGSPGSRFADRQG